jgi:predicted nucleic acid-binding protein
VSELFVDTSAFHALANLADAHHLEAVQAFEAKVGVDRLTTSDHVVVETWCLLRARLGRVAAMRFWDGFDSGVVGILGVQEADFRRGRQIAREWPDQAFSIVDCTSFALIERRGIGRAFAFDRHFRIFRLGPTRRRALEIVPH